MYFEAEMKKKKFRLEVTETKNEWRVMVHPDGGEKETIVINKADYTHFDDAVSYLTGGRSYMMDVVHEKNQIVLYTQGSYRAVKIFNDEMLLHESLKQSGGMAGSDSITAGMPGKIVKIFVKPGDKVEENTPVLIMEAMKMENEIRASKPTTVKEVLVKEGASVEVGAVLIKFES